MNVRYVGSGMFRVARPCGFLWRKEKLEYARWDSGWKWEDGSRVKNHDIRIALCEAALKVEFSL